MYYLLRILLLACVLPMLSCGGDEEDNGLAISITPAETFLLPGELTITDTCYGDDASFTENHLTFTKIETQWTGNGTFLPIVVGITLRNGTQEQECVISDGESISLGVFLGYGATELDNSTTDPDVAGPGVSVASLCELRCGGLSGDENATFVTEIKLIGIQTTTDADGNDTQTPISTTTTVNVRSLDL